MAKVSIELIAALRATARSLEVSASYQWGHMGLCNCGFLAQQVTSLTKEEIHRRAMQKHGDWSEQLNDYCPSSGLPMDDLISELIAFGFERGELCHLEYLSDHTVLSTLPVAQRSFERNVKGNAIAYFLAWANLLEEQLLEKIVLPSISELHATAKI